jgi:hypothetical protein
VPKCPYVTGNYAAGAFWAHLSEKPLHTKGSRLKSITKNDDDPVSFTPVGNSADSRAPLLRWSFATGHAAEILDEYDPYLGYYPETFPYQLPP